MWCGYTLGDRQVYLWGSDVDAKRHRSFKGRLRASLQNLIWVDVFDLTEEALRRQLSEIARPLCVKMSETVSPPEIIPQLRSCSLPQLDQ